MKTVFLGLGSNLGNRKKNLENAIHQIQNHEFIWVQQIAAFIETDPIAQIPQPKFINSVIKIETILTPEELLQETQTIEKKLGRTEKGNHQPRTIDIDLLLYGQDVICSEMLTIPHPLLHERSFVLTPLNELAPDLIHPILLEPISRIYQRVVGY